jgi:hypothetical protein
MFLICRSARAVAVGVYARKGGAWERSAGVAAALIALADERSWVQVNIKYSHVRARKQSQTSYRSYAIGSRADVMGGLLEICDWTVLPAIRGVRSCSLRLFLSVQLAAVMMDIT